MQYANQYGWSDVEPYEVIRVVSDKTLEVREMACERDDSVKLEFIPGGFSAHCPNQRAQKWHIRSDESGRVVRIRLQKSGVWKDKHGRKYDLSDKPVKFYDFNF